MRSRHRRLRLRGSRAEKGAILAMSALLLIPMLAFTGFATDVGSWYARASRMQRAADAASLAGVVQMPNFNSGTTNATSVALDTAERNGFEDGVDGIEVNVYEVGPRQIRVEIIDSQVEVYFTSIFFDEIDITREATAEYLQSLPMGSPENFLGNDPLRSPVPSPYPNYWLNIGANNTEKAQGDRYTNGSCTGSSVGGLTTGCSSTANWGANTELDPQGYFYAVKVDSVTSGQPLRIQVFDPAFTDVGSTCGSNTLSGTQLSALAGLSETTMNDAVTRFAAGNGLFCTGDSDPGGNSIPGSPNSNQGPMNTSFIVRGPDQTEYDNTDNPAISGCSRTFTGRSNEGNGINYLNGGTGIYDRLRESSAYNSSTVAEQGYEQIGFRQHYRQWYTLCTIPAGSVSVGTYYVQVRSNASLANLPTSALQVDSNNDRGGHNRFSLRAGFGSTGTPTGTNVTTFAEGRLPIYVNADSTTTTFYLARIDERYQGEVLSLDFFDIGDISSGNVDFQVLPPDEATTSSGALDSFPGCTIVRDGTAGHPAPGTISGCGVNDMTSTNYQGRKTNVQIPIPTTYDCDEDNTGGVPGCWVRIRMVFSPGAQPTDQTTWTASVLGEPVRLVE